MPPKAAAMHCAITPNRVIQVALSMPSPQYTACGISIKRKSCASPRRESDWTEKVSNTQLCAVSIRKYKKNYEYRIGTY